MLGAYSTIVRPNSATYCSAPVTSGIRYFQWLARTGRRFEDVDEIELEERAAHAAEVVHENRLHSQRVVDELRHTRSQVIDPAAAPHVPGWSQADWLDFWERVIARFAADVVFVDGWQYSYGCSHEFWFAHARGIPTYDERGKLLSIAEGLVLIRGAVEYLASNKAAAARLGRVAELVSNL